MFDRGAWLTVAALSVVAVGCAKRTDAEARRAFERAQGRDPLGQGPRSEVVEGGGKGTFSRDKLGWDRVAEVLDSAVTIQRGSPDETRMAELAAQWCAVEPEPRDTDHGPVRVCNPEPPVIADGTSFTLELGGDGVVGLVAGDLSRADSETLAAMARERVTPLCTEPWLAATPDVDVAEPSFVTCPTEGGPLLSVGRFPGRPAAPDGSCPWPCSPRGRHAGL